MTPMANDRLKILVAEDSDSDRLILQTIVRRLGHEVLTAVDGQQAVDCFREERPQLVLLDALMPRMDGLQAARRIKAWAGEELVPIIFLTSLSDAGELARCLDAGGDDFLPKPYNPTILEAKINAFNRMRMMHGIVQQQRDLIRERNEMMLHEQQLARRVFDNVAHSGCLDAPNIRHLISPMSIFNGDVLFACPKPYGGMHVFLGDFTGHGLPAAIGAMPLAEIFYSMTSKGFTIGDILREANQTLKRILPTGMFCCGTMVDVNLHLQEVEVWNGGLPDGYLLRSDGSFTPLKSRHLPLGVLGTERFSVVSERYTMERGECLIFCSDGILEATNADDEMFGQDRLEWVIGRCHRPQKAFDALLAELTQFTGRAENRDDVSLVEITMAPESLLSEIDQRVNRSALEGPSRWCSSYELRGHALGQFNPLPMLLQICMEVPGLRPFGGQVYTVLAEMFSNALEHGILRLSSELKRSAQGFSLYYAERASRLEHIEDEWIRFSLEHVPQPRGGRLDIVCEDSGSGFDYTAHIDRSEAQSSTPSKLYSGRGIALLRELCRNVRYSEKGNRVAAEFHWSFDAHTPSETGEEEHERKPTPGP